MRPRSSHLAPLVVILAGIGIVCGTNLAEVAAAVPSTPTAARSVGGTSPTAAGTPSVSPTPPFPTRHPKNQAPQVTAAIDSLRTDPPLYNSPHAPLTLTDSQEVEVKAAITAAGTPIYVAILPKTENQTEVAKEIFEGLGQPGTYVVVVGTVFDTYSTLFDAKPNLTRAFAQERANNTAAVLAEFSTLVGHQADGTQAAPGEFPWAPTLIVLAIFLVGGGIFLGLRARGGAKPNRAAPQPPQ